MAGERTSRTSAGWSTERSDAKSERGKEDGVGRRSGFQCRGHGPCGRAACVHYRRHHKHLNDGRQGGCGHLGPFSRLRCVDAVVMAQHRLLGVHARAWLASRHHLGHCCRSGLLGANIVRQRQLIEQQRQDHEGQKAVNRSAARHDVLQEFNSALQTARTSSRMSNAAGCDAVAPTSTHSKQCTEWPHWITPVLERSPTLEKMKRCEPPRL